MGLTGNEHGELAREMVMSYYDRDAGYLDINIYQHYTAIFVHFNVCKFS